MQHFKFKVGSFHIRRVYLFACLSVIFLIGGMQLLTQTNLQLQRDKAELINTAGTQRTISQRISKKMLMLEKENVDKEDLIRRIKDLDQRWGNVHRRLKNAEDGFGIPQGKNPVVDSLFHLIQPSKDKISFAIASLHKDLSNDEIRAISSSVLGMEDVYLQLMDQIVMQYQLDLQESLHALSHVELLLSFGCILIILVEFMLIFRPAFKSMKFQHEQLKAAYTEQEQLNKELSVTEEELRQSMETLEATNEELEYARKRAEQAAQAKADFLSTMSHEIRTPMNGVIGITHLLLEDNPKPSQKENLKSLKFSAENLLSLINDILDFSKIEAGKVELEYVDFSLSNLMEGIMFSLDILAKEKDISLTYSIDPQLPDIVTTDPSRLTQILNNLLGNAIKFTLHGSVSLTISKGEASEKECHYIFEVRDTGIGIPEEKLDSIFHVFSQANTSTSRIYGGSGLGLSITRRLVELMGGSLEVQSEVHKGSCFCFSLPISIHERRIEAEEANMKGPQLMLQGFRILVAEDNRMNILVISQFLKKWVADFTIVENGLLAVNEARDKQYDLILMDLQMPVMDGLQACMEIRKFDQEIPIIALTASATLEAQNQAVENGISDFATKPFVPEELLKKMERYLRQKHQNSFKG
jgi:signal transduction histidine kinase/CheY-like chemotaxis protein